MKELILGQGVEQQRIQQQRCKRAEVSIDLYRQTLRIGTINSNQANDTSRQIYG